MRLAPDQRRVTAAVEHNQSIGHGMEFALVVLVFVGVGALLDNWLGTWPWCTVGLVVLSFVGQFARLYYTYTETMERLEAERREVAAARRTAKVGR